MRQLIWMSCTSLLLLVSGCNTQIITGEAAERLRHPIPFGARWVKDGMTRESRLSDWVACGGGADMGDGFRKWMDPESWESFWSSKQFHVEQLSTCMQSKSYAFHRQATLDTPDQCDARCLHPNVRYLKLQ